MGIINWLISLGRSKREAKLPIQGKKYCVACKQMIEEGQPRTKQLGMHYHRSCWKMQQRG